MNLDEQIKRLEADRHIIRERMRSISEISKLNQCHEQLYKLNMKIIELNQINSEIEYKELIGGSD
jgi:TolA-binding protein